MHLDSSTLAAVVTGGASGLGEAAARALAAKGVKVALFDMNADRGELIAREIGGVFCAVNVTLDDSVDSGFVRARAVHGQERILINCAGTGNAIKTAYRDKSTGAIRHFPTGEFDRIIQINLIGTFRCLAKSVAGMMTLDVQPAGDRGVVINTASIAAEDGQIGQASYSASKGGITAMTLPIARDLMNESIRINTILPGLFNTPLLAAAPEAVKSTLAASVPFPEATRGSARVCAARIGHHREQLFQWRMRSSRRCNPVGPTLTLMPGREFVVPRVVYCTAIDRATRSSATWAGGRCHAAHRCRD